MAVTSLLTAILLSQSLSVAYATSMVATNAPQVAGKSVNFKGEGFQAGELVSAWTTAPNGAVAALKYTQADAGGLVSYSLDTLGSITGRWYLTVHGQRSGQEAIAPFDLVNSLPDTPPPATPTPAPDPTGDSSSGAAQDVPQGGLSVSPNVGQLGTTFKFMGYNYAPGERVELWQTDPLGYASKLNYIYSDLDGKVEFSYTGHIPTGGVWAVTAHGRVSGVEKVGYFRLVI